MFIFKNRIKGHDLMYLYINLYKTLFLKSMLHYTKNVLSLVVVSQSVSQSVKGKPKAIMHVVYQIYMYIYTFYWQTDSISLYLSCFLFEAFSLDMYVYVLLESLYIQIDIHWSSTITITCMKVKAREKVGKAFFLSLYKSHNP